MAALSDESLLSGMAAGDAHATAAFVRRFQARVFGMAVTIVGNQDIAQDVAQEAFVKAWRHAATYDPRRGGVPSWLLTITRNAAIDAVRGRREEPIDTDLLFARIAAAQQPAAPSGYDLEIDDQLQRAVRELPAAQSRPLGLMVFYGLTGKQIAAMDGIPIGTVKTRVRRALGALRQRLGTDPTGVGERGISDE